MFKSINCRYKVSLNWADAFGLIVGGSEKRSVLKMLKACWVSKELAGFNRAVFDTCRNGFVANRFVGASAALSIGGMGDGTGLSSSSSSSGTDNPMCLRTFRWAFRRLKSPFLKSSRFAGWMAQ